MLSKYLCNHIMFQVKTRASHVISFSHPSLELVQHLKRTMYHLYPTTNTQKSRHIFSSTTNFHVIIHALFSIVSYSSPNYVVFMVLILFFIWDHLHTSFRLPHICVACVFSCLLNLVSCYHSVISCLLGHFLF